MQTILVTKSAILSATFTCDMLKELGVTYLKMTQEAVDKLAAQRLSKPSKDLADLECNKLRTVLMQKLEQSPDEEYGELYRKGELTLEFFCLPDLDVGDIGKNTKRTRKQADGQPRQTVRSSDLKGEYEIVKRAGTCTAETDPGKWEIWQHVWECKSFEEYFAKAPKKTTTKTGRVVTAASEMQWALKSGWIKPKATAEQPEQKEQATA